jgi:paraquat-inducible protein B
VTDKTPADLDLTRAPDPVWTRLSVVWVVPLIALIVSLGVAWQSYVNRGTDIEILFDDATGIVPDQTVLKYREVDVGRVQQVRFTDDLQQVVVTVRVQRDVARFVDSEAQFWVVQPQLTVAGISRLDTVLSGIFIEGTWDAVPGEPQTRFTALPGQPAVRDSERGITITLTADDGASLRDGAPVLYRGIQVGRLSNLRLADGASGVMIDAFIEAPHSARISTMTAFWNVSGFSASLGLDGLTLNVRSLGTLVQGGVEYATLSDGGQPVDPGQRFRLHDSEQVARRSLFSDADLTTYAFSVLLESNEPGLTTGAQVMYRGRAIGRVTGQTLEVAEDGGNGRIVRERVDFVISPERMGLPGTTNFDDLLDFLRDRAEAGLRVRVVSTGLLGGGLALELVELPEAGAARLDASAIPYPLLPAGPPDIVRFQDTAEGLLERFKALPIEETFNSFNDLMRAGTRLISNQNLQDTPEAALGLLADVRRLVQSDSVQATPEALRAALDEARGLLGEVRAARLDLALLEAVNATSEAAGFVREAATGVPELVQTLDEVAKGAAAAPIEETVVEAQRVLAQLTELIGSDETRALPGRLGGALDELGAVLSDLRAGGAVENVNAAMASARDAAGAVSSASERLPDLIARLDRAMTEISTTLAAYGDRSAFNSETLTMLREFRRAAESVGSLARTLERNPNSLILGR